jgi:hypothetical protein
MIPQLREGRLFPRLYPSFRTLWWLPLLLFSEFASTAANTRETGGTRDLAAQSNSMDQRHGALSVEQSQFLRRTNSLDAKVTVLDARSDQYARATERRADDNKTVVAPDPTPVAAVPDNAGNDPVQPPAPAPVVEESAHVQSPKGDPPVAQPTDPPKDPPTDPSTDRPTDPPTDKNATSPPTPTPQAKPEPVTKPVAAPKATPETSQPSQKAQMAPDPPVQADPPADDDDHGCGLGDIKDCHNCKVLATSATEENAKWTCVWKETTGNCEAALLSKYPNPIWCKGDPTKSPTTKPLKPEPVDDEGNNMMLFAAIGAAALIGAILVWRRCTTNRSPAAVGNPSLGKYQGV